MTLYHAVAYVDHQSSQIFQFSSEQVHAQKMHTSQHYTQQHGSGIRSQHEFYARICDAFDGIAEILVVGGHTGMADFRHYVDKHRPLTAKQIVDYQVVDHPTDGQLFALAKKYFVKYDRMIGVPMST